MSAVWNDAATDPFGKGLAMGVLAQFEQGGHWCAGCLVACNDR